MRLLFFLPVLFLNLYMHGAYCGSRVSEWEPAKGRIAILKHENRFALHDGMHEQTIRPELISKQLRSLDDVKLTALLNSGNAYIKVGRCIDGQLTLDLATRTYGGGWGGAWFGGVAGEVVGKAAPLLIGYAILYGTKGVIRVTAGREAADIFGQTIVETSIPHLHEVTETIAHVGGALGVIIGGVATPV